MKKALTSLFGLIPTNDIDVDGANEFMKGIMTGLIDKARISELHGLVASADDNQHFEMVRNSLS